MNKFDITFRCEQGEYKLNECSIFPTGEQLADTMETLEHLGLGKTESIIIDKFG